MTASAVTRFNTRPPLSVSTLFCFLSLSRVISYLCSALSCPTPYPLHHVPPFPHLSCPVLLVMYSPHLSCPVLLVMYSPHLSCPVLLVMYSPILIITILSHQVFWSRMNVVKVLRACEKALLWNETVYLYKVCT